jgi:Flp pilus assembly protein TadG
VLAENIGGRAAALEPSQGRTAQSGGASSSGRRRCLSSQIEFAPKHLTPGRASQPEDQESPVPHRQPPERDRRKAVHTRRRDQRGAAVVEAALTLPLVIMLIFGMVTGGVALAQKNAIENAAREASRLGATLEVATSVEEWLDDVTAAAIGASTGELDAGTPGRYLCVALVGTATGDDGRKVISGDSVTYGSGACPGMTCPSATPCVQLALARDGYLDLVFSSKKVRMTAASVTTFERI